MPGRKIYTSDFQFDYGGIVDDTIAGLKQQTDLLSAALQATERRILAGQQATATDVKQTIRESEGRLTAEVRAVPAAIDNPNFYRNNPNLQSAGNQNGGNQMPDHAHGGGGQSGSRSFSLGEVIFWIIVAVILACLVIYALGSTSANFEKWWASIQRTHVEAPRNDDKVPCPKETFKAKNADGVPEYTLNPDCF